MSALDGINILGKDDDPNAALRASRPPVKPYRGKVEVAVQNYPVLNNTEIVVYTDGSVYTIQKNYAMNPKNPGGKHDIGRTFGAYAFAVWNQKTGDLLYEEVKAGEWKGRQVPELLGVHFALKYLHDNYQGHTATLFSDSEYILNSLGCTWYPNGWYYRWDENGWITYDGNPVKYAKHFKAMVGHIKQFNHPDNRAMIHPFTLAPLNLYHVKGHHDDERNHYVDKLAGDRRREYQENVLNGLQNP